MSRSRRRPKKKRPGDGCFLCDPKAQEEARRRKLLDAEEQTIQDDLDETTKDRTPSGSRVSRRSSV